MRFHWTLFIITILLCGCDKKETLFLLPSTPSEQFSFELPQSDTASIHRRHQLIKEELDYYLQRHDVMDEGFDMVARYAEEGDSTLTAYRPQGGWYPFEYIKFPHAKREGKHIIIDPWNRIIIGNFHNDTLVSGIRIDSLGTYAGQFNRHLQANGHGSYQESNGTYYEGHWQNDRRQGYGFSVSPTSMKAGQWKANRFLGERMLYTTERIYGIDISRYQHEKGRRRYGINWRQLRIKHLGRRISEQRVDGEVDYPISFVYIKSTEGISINNRYFAADYQSCHQQGIRVGAYHFLSTRQDPAVQANHFLKQTKFHKGDMPPMLDVEPSDAHIAQMGGIMKVFDNIRIWVKIVEQRTGTRPILYVNQRFVNTYLNQAPDLKHNYHFWIARYGEYKPDIHLALWQLSADGIVRGIQGPVDLNVFNGYQGQWDEFLREETIK